MHAVIAEALRPLAAPIDNLVPDPNNARRGDVEAIRRSLSVFGQRKPIVVRRTGTDAQGRPTGIVVAGNHTLQAAVALGWDHVAAVFSDDDETTAKAYALADNRTGELAGWDDEQLAATLQELAADEFEMASLGWTDDQLAAILNPRSGRTDPDAAPTPPAQPHCQRGELWLLGPHRLVCGDATAAADVERLLAGDLADVMWTDPPYGVGYTGKTRDALTIDNDDEPGLAELLGAAFTVASGALVEGAPFYVAHADSNRAVFEQAVRAAGWRFRQNLVWVKDQMVLGRSDYHYRHEPILYGFTAGGSGRLGRGGERWYGDDARTTVFEVPKPSRSAEHPTMKPVELVEAMLGNSAPSGALVYDPFAGSGSTLIAAHRLGMRAAVLELDARYAHVICRRFQEHTGVKPVLEATGQPHDFTDAEGGAP